MPQRLSPALKMRSPLTIPLALFSLGAVLFGVATLVLRGGDKQVPIAPREPVIVSQFDTVEVPVPAAQVAQGTRLGGIQLRWIKFPKHQVPPGAITSLEGLGELITTSSLPSGLPLFYENFTAASARLNPVAEQIPAGMRAIAIRVDATAAVEGWASSGSMVDVILVTQRETRVIAENVRVLSAERSVTPVDSGTAPLPSTVTLLVSREQVLAITTAAPLGRLQLALRGHSDDSDWSSRSFSADRLGSAEKKGEKIAGTITVGGRTLVLINDSWQPAVAKPPSAFESLAKKEPVGIVDAPESIRETNHAE